MTEPAAQPPPARPQRPSRIKTGTCRNCGRTDQRLPAFGFCWACYAAPRRAARRPTPPPLLQRAHQRALREITDAHTRVLTTEQARKDADQQVRKLTRLAHGDGIPLSHLGPLVGRIPTTVEKWIPPDQRRGRRTGVPGVSDAKLGQWQPLLVTATERRDEAEDRAWEAKRLRAEVLAEVTGPGNPYRVEKQVIAGHLRVSPTTLSGWTNPVRRPTRPQEPKVERCIGEYRGHQAPGRCRRRARPGRKTCYIHDDQELS